MTLINNTKSAIKLINNSKNKLNSKISFYFLFYFKFRAKTHFK